MGKKLIAIGHTASGNIGCGAVGNLDESNCTREIGPKVVDKLINEGEDSIVIRVDKGNSYSYEDCYTRADWANNIGGDSYTEVHINAGGKGATGVEILVNSETSSMKETAERVCANISESLGIPNRGVKVQRLIVLSRTNMPAMLVECCFVDDPDASKYDADKIASAIAGAILNKEITSNEWILGWNERKGRWFYCTDINNKYYYKSSWQLLDGYWYLFDSEGWCITGWVYYQTYKDKKDVWYYLDSVNCDMAIGWKQVNSKWYYFDSNGEMKTGWIKDNGKDYFLYSSGAMIVNTVAYGYKFDSSGVATKLS